MAVLRKIGRAWNRFEICSEKQQQTQNSKKKKQQQSGSFGVLSLAPATWTRRAQCQRVGSEVCTTVFLFSQCLELEIRCQDVTN